MDTALELFQREVFGSAVFERRGFPSAAYTQIPGSGSAVEWEAKQQSDSEGSLAWSAEFQEKTMKGSLVWRKPDGKMVKYSLVGAPATEEEAAASGAAPKKSFWGCSLFLTKP